MDDPILPEEGKRYLVYVDTNDFSSMDNKGHVFVVDYRDEKFFPIGAPGSAIIRSLTIIKEVK